MSYEFAGGYTIRDQAATHFLTFTIIGWIDLFSRQRYRDIIIESFAFCRKNKGLQIGAFVIMSNHIHVKWTALNGTLSDIIRDFKTYTSKAMFESILKEPESRKEWLQYMFRFFGNKTNANENFKIWSGDNHPEAIYKADFLELNSYNYF
jgi:putative transposase